MELNLTPNLGVKLNIILRFIYFLIDAPCYPIVEF